MGFILTISRRGHFRAGSLIFIGLLVLSTAQLILAWGHMLQIVVLMEILIIIVVGILFSARWGLKVSLIIATSTIILGLLNHIGSFSPDLSWRDDQYMVGNAIGFSGLFLIIGLLPWLPNRETSYSLNRARASELALKIERDNLEGKVIERTKQLEVTQMTRLMELQKFAEFGRLNANLLHEISNPLTSAKLNLELAGKGMPNQISQVSNNLKQMERYLLAARHQINETSVDKYFLIDKEIKQILEMMELQVHKAGITVFYKSGGKLKLKGDPVKFNQLVRNLLSNSIDSYRQTSKCLSEKSINIFVELVQDFIIISVKDFGQGLTEDQINRIFEPFYTTKASSKRNLGLGLAMVKRYVEQDFKGKVEVKSDVVEGTIFKVSLKLNNN
jgi:signal transduction histidine kinase